MSSAMKIEDFIPYYPEPITPYTAAKYEEFAELSVGAGEEGTKVGSYLPHQELIRRLIGPSTSTPGMLVFHSTGTGKGCVAAAVAETYKREFVDGKTRRPALVLVKNDSLEQTFKKEVAEVCVKLDYLPKMTLAERGRLDLDDVPKGLSRDELHEALRKDSKKMDEKLYSMRLTRLISKAYTIATFGTFLENFDRNFPTDVTIHNEFDNRVIIVDEVHNIRQGGLTMSMNLDGDAGEELDDEKHEVPRGKRRDGKADKQKKRYAALHKLLHTAVNTRVLLLTATPIWDSTREIASIMNLLLPLDQQLPVLSKFEKEFFNEDGSVIEDKVDVLRDAFKGRVSYLRAPYSNAKRVEDGVTEPYTRFLKVIPSPMSEHQANVAIRKWRDETARDVLQGPRAAANFVFPDGSTDTEGFEKHCVVKVKGKDEKTKVMYQLDGETANVVSKIEGLRKCSCKFADILEDIMCHPDALQFVYSQAVTGSGAILLGLIMQLYGFRWVKSKADFGSGPRFAVITNDPETTNDIKAIRSVLAEFNRPENVQGTHLRVIIGSRTIAEGVTLKNVTRVHIVQPHWNLSALDQAVGRAYRFGSHNALEAFRKDHGDDRPVEVHIMRHIAVFSKKPLPSSAYTRGMCEPYPPFKPVLDEENGGPDIYVARLAESKEYRNVNVYRLMKEESMDCVLNYKRNVLAADPDGSRECDFRVCDYVCADVPEKFVHKGGDERLQYDIPVTRTDNKILLFSNDEVETLKERVKGIMQTHVAILFDTLIQMTGASDERLLLFALEDLIDKRTPILDIYGFSRYLAEDNDLYYLAVDPNDVSPDETVYVSEPIATERYTFDEELEILALIQQEKIVKTMCSVNNPLDVYRGLHHRTKIPVLEAVVKAINEKYPSAKRVASILNDGMKNLYFLDNNEVAHVMYGTEFRGASYNIVVKRISPTGKTRIFRDGKWQYPKSKEDEEEIVKRILKAAGRADTSQSPIAHREEATAVEFDAPIYGRLVEKKGVKEFQIVRRRNEMEKKRNRGIVCKTDNASRIIETIFEVDGLPEPDVGLEDKSATELMGLLELNISQSPSKIDGDMVMKMLGDDPSVDRILRTMTLVKMKKLELCKHLENVLREKGLVFG